MVLKEGGSVRGGKVEEGLTHEARWGFPLVCYKIKLVQF